MSAQAEQEQWDRRPMAFAAVAWALAILHSACSNGDLGGNSGPAMPSGGSGPLSFSVDVEVIFAQKCFECHDGQSEEADLDLRTVDSILEGGENGPAIVRGQPGQSLLLRKLASGHPPAGSEPLSARELTLVRRWISEGARY